jgi:maltose/moltooligosaccharide transporter
MSAVANPKPRLSFVQIWNMSFGFFGIQFGWMLQMGNMSAIYEFLGAKPEDIPMLWLAAPLTGLIVQPIIGYMSDRTWTRLGRRRPYFLVGAILSSVALIFMPNSAALWMAAGLLWIMDASINISMEPFRAFVVDMLPEEQQSKGFAMQSFMIGAGSVVAGYLPFMLTEWFGVSKIAEAGQIPPAVEYAFYIGAFFFLTAVLYTIFTTKPYPPADMDQFLKMKAEKVGVINVVREIADAIRNMPLNMRRVALVQFFTWPGLFLMWFYFTPAVATDIFGGEPGTEAYTDGVIFANGAMSFYNLITFFFALAIPLLAEKISKKYTHLVCLFAGGLGLFSVAFVTTPWMLYLSMTGVGIAWASILSMPYALMAGSLPAEKIGIYMGIFNFFIVLPEIIASVGFGWVMEHVLGNDRMAALMVGGVLLIIAGFLCIRVIEEHDSRLTP